MSDLPEFSDAISRTGADGFPEDFSVLFRHPQARLLQNGKGAIVVFRNKDLVEIAANPAVTSMPMEYLLDRGSLVGYSSIERFMRNLVFTADRPSHMSRRQMIARPLMPRQVASLAPLAERIVRELISEVAGRGIIDFTTQFCLRFTVKFWSALFKMTDHEESVMPEILHGMTPLLFLSRTPEESSLANMATGRYLDLISTAIHRSLCRDGCDLLQAMSAGFDVVDSESKPDPIGVMIAANVFEGIHTAAVGSANAVYQLLRCPEALAAARADPSLASNAVAEGLRLSPPLTITERYASEDLELAGVAIPRGTAVGMLWAAGNRDPGAYENPNRYEIFRRQRNEMTFGGGARICPGRYTVRMLVNTVIQGILAPDIRIDLTTDRPTWLARSFGRQLSSMPVTIRRL